MTNQTDNMNDDAEDPNGSEETDEISLGELAPFRTESEGREPAELTSAAPEYVEAAAEDLSNNSDADEVAAAPVEESPEETFDTSDEGAVEITDVAEVAEEIADRSDADEVAAAPVEETAGDCFITYTRKLTLPAVTISGASCLQTRVTDLGRLRVKNNSNFSYSISLPQKPDWLIVEPAELTLEPGQEASFALGVDQGHLPPGRNRSIGELAMRRPFINRPYPFEVSIDVDYVTPAPRIEIVAQPGTATNTLRIAVRNGGSGLLQGYYYDRNRNERKTFLLAGDSARADQKQSGDAPDRLRTFGNQLFEIEREFQDMEEVEKGFLIACDCINERFRRFEITPETYFKGKSFADLPFIDFMEVEAGQSHECEIVIRHPAFREGCSIMIPPRLQQHLQFTQLGKGRIRFSVSNQASALGAVADHIEFKSASGAKRKLPIIISFREPIQTSMAAPVGSGSYG